MGGLAHYIESAGIATTQISLVRLHTEKMRPPRALWVPFELGRPFGPPNDAPFQTRVVVAALKLFGLPQGPVLVDYPEEAPQTTNEDSGWSCPINFVHRASELNGDAALAAAVTDEIARLRPWYDIARSKRGRTTVGASSLEIEQIAEFFPSLLAPVLPSSPIVDLPLADAIRLAAEDLKAFYFEAVSAQPGAPSSRQLVTWFWKDTSAGTLLNTLKNRFEASDDSGLKLLGQLLLVPRAAVDMRR